MNKKIDKLHWKQIMILAFLHKHNTGIIKNDISRMLSITYSHVVMVVNELREEGLLSISDKIGRKRIITLTPKGMKLSKICYNMYNELNKGEKNGKSN